MTTPLALPCESQPRDLPAGMHLARRFWYAARRWWWNGYFRLQTVNADFVPEQGPAIFCSNHTSHLDAMAILAALPREVALRSFTAAARDVFGDFWLRRLLSQMTTNALPIRRAAEFSTGLRQIEMVLRDRHPLILFPEGKRSVDGRMNAFKNGASMLSVRTGSPIVPIFIRGADEALPKGSLIPTATKVSVEFGTPIDPAGFIVAIGAGAMSRHEAYDALTAELRGAIAAMKARDDAARLAREHHRKSRRTEEPVNLSPA